MARLFLPSLLALSLLTFASLAHADVTVDFENLPNPDGSSNLNYQGTSVTQNGFGVVGSNLRSVKPNSTAFNYTGSVALFDLSGTDMTLTALDSQPFNLLSLDSASWFIDSSARTYVITGHLAGGGVVTQSFTHSASNSLETATFGSNFSNLASVSLPGQASTQYDNIIVAPFATETPEPGTTTLLAGLALSGIAFLRRKRARA
jgi:hypothetical protein